MKRKISGDFISTRSDYNDDYNSDYYLIADFKARTVRTNCGDFYYDYDIGFDAFIKFAKYIEKEDRRLNGKEKR